MTNRLICIAVIFVLSLLDSPLIVAQAKKHYPITGHAAPALQHFSHQFVKFIKKWDIPGAEVAIIKNNYLVLARGYGWADVKQSYPIQPDSLFRIASVSKAITAVAILKLVQNGQLSLDDKAFKILNNLKPQGKRRINAKVYNISIRNLLQMSSG